MAERSNATARKTQGAAPDVTTLQKRGRRRLVGAIALVLLAVIVLPMVFDPEPKPNAPLVSVRIPGEDGSKFTPKVAPKPAAAQPEPAQAKPAEAATAVPAPVAVTTVEKPAEKPAPKAAAAKPVEKPASKVAAKAATLAPVGEQLIFQVGAFASADKVKEIADQLKEAKLPHYTESVATSTGTVTRVRLGPFTSKEAAEKGRERAMALGLNPAPVASK